MSEDFNHIDALLAAYFSGNADEAEQAEVEVWAAESKENRAIFEASRKIYASSQTLTPAAYNVDAAWEKVRSQVEVAPKTIALKSENITESKRWFKPNLVAAAVGIFILGFLALRMFNTKVNVTTITANAQLFADTLSDETFMRLEAGSSVEFDKTTFAQNRTVKLKGSAYFEVNNKEGERFKVSAGDVLIEDVGTAFHVQIVSPNVVQVQVSEGVVWVKPKFAEGVMLYEKEKIEIKDGKFISLDKPEKPIEEIEEVPSLSFENANLQEVVARISNLHKVEIKLASGIENCRIVVDFNNESPEQMLEIIAETLGLTLTKSSNGFVLNGSACAP